MTGTIVERARAKLNVFLRVLGRREDGYHELQTVILPIELHDVVRVEPAEVFSVHVEGPLAGELAARGGESLVARAAVAFGEAFGLDGPPSVRVTIEKRIPVGAGLGGGSADAAALLRVCGRLHDVRATDLVRVAATVGSDVPALVLGGPVYAEGRGERVTPIHALTTHWVVRPFRFPVPTPDAYAWWDAVRATGPDVGALIASSQYNHIANYL
jgi:4-diphosphocytidyl-2-C-methyl-D-erythritol kinase